MDVQAKIFMAGKSMMSMETKAVMLVLTFVADDVSWIRQHPMRVPALPNPSPVVVKSSGLEWKTMARPRI